MHVSRILVLLAAIFASSHAQTERLCEFSVRKLDESFRGEGAAFVDIDGDGILDAVNADRWWRGPAFTESHLWAEAKTFDPKGYSETFFIWGDDLDGDKDQDLLVVGFPGRELRWHENPGVIQDTPWTRHTVFEGVDNESPAYEDMDRNGRREIVAMHGGALGFITPPASGDAKQPWVFTAITPPGQGGNFTHGLGVGDINGDGLKDVLLKNAWFQHPPLHSILGWARHDYAFAEAGGAQMLVFDADGDGLADVITADNAHGYGMTMHRQRRDHEGRITFRAERFMGSERRHNRFGCCVGGLHAAAMVDLSGDGIPDVLTGNRPFAHAGRDPADRGAATLVWFETLRGPGQDVQFVPHVIDDVTGVGTQVTVDDVEHDGAADIVVSNKLGFSVVRGRVRSVPRSEWQAQQPRAIGDFAADARPQADWAALGVPPRNAAGQPINADFENGSMQGWTLTGDAFNEQPIRGDTVHARRADMHSGHLGEWWVGGYEGRRRDAGQGRCTSEDFVLEHPWLSFLVGGGAWPETRVDIVRASDGQVLASSRGRETEDLTPVAHDLSVHVGTTLRVVLVDERQGHWAHINFDHLRLHATQPVFGERKLTSAGEQVVGFPASLAARRMIVPDGFSVDAIAAEPVIHQPIAMTIDARSRIWVAEAYAYPRRVPEAQARDRILVLEDRDKDGSFEHVTVFADKLNLISGLEVGHGGVFVGAAPYLLFIADKNDDLVPDAAPEVLLDGFGWQDTHETLNAFCFGPDGWLYGCHGVFTHSRVGKPGCHDSERIPMNAAVWRWHPVRRVFETFAEGTSNPWGVDFDATGEAFVSACVIPHLWHLVPGGRYERQAGSHFEPWLYEDIGTIADHRHYVGGDPHGGNGISDSAGGGHAHCGLLIYQGDSFPLAWRGRALMDNIHGNRINADAFAARGASFTGSHAPDLLVSDDRFFRAIAFRHAPDGSVLFTDWYDKQACHRNEPEIWDRSNGRLYRLRFGAPRAWTEDLTRLSNAELITLLSHPNAWHQRKAREVLAMRKLEAADDLALAQRLTDPLLEVRLRAFWARLATGTLQTAECLRALEDEAPAVRAWAVRASTEALDHVALDRALTHVASSETDAVVLRETASALLRVEGAARLNILRILARTAQSTQELTTPLLLWRGLAPLLPEHSATALSIFAETPLTELKRWIPRRLLSCGAEAQRQVLAAGASPAIREHVLAALEDALARKTRIESSPELQALLTAGLADGATAAIAERVAALLGHPIVLARARTVLANKSAPAPERMQALATLARGNDSVDLPLFLDALQSAELVESAAHALARHATPTVNAALLEAAQRTRGVAQQSCIAVLLARKEGAHAALSAMASGALTKDLLDAPARRQIALHGDSEVNRLLEVVWGRVRPEPRAMDRIAAMRTQFKDTSGADLSRGRALFARTCRHCHRLFDDGRQLGPELTGSNRADLDYLLTNILDPSAEVPREYALTNVRLEDGRLLSGVVKKEDEAHIELWTAEAHHVIARDEIAMGSDGTRDLWQSESSAMPEDQLQGWPHADIRDLLAYLMSKEQVPMTADERTLPLFFDGTSLTLWRGDPAVWSVEQGAIVGRTTSGLARNTFLVSDLLLDNFRLELDVELVGNVGNSGVQFRSEPLPDGEMKGLQADIGPGWWGVLYEESGRGILMRPEGAEPGGAGKHHYEIVACGTRVMTAMDGRILVDLNDSKIAQRGRIGLQVHSGGPTEVRFSNLRLERITEAMLKSVRSGK